MRMSTVVAVVAGGLALGTARGQGIPDGSQTYSLRSSTRLVIEDVLVTDKAGNAVTGLPASAFHVTDDGVAQKLIDFSEVHGLEQAATTAQPEEKGVFSNAAMKNPGGRVIVLLIDTVGMELQDQMYLRLQMLKYLKTMPEGIDVAVFRNIGTGKPLLVQSLTTDHALLVKAVNNSIPTIPRPVLTTFSDAVSEIGSISYYLAQIPGRKQLIWFAGAFPLFESPLGLYSTADVSTENEQLRLAYELLEKARVEVFPVDVRGVTMGGPPINTPPQANASTGNPDPTTPGLSAPGDSAMDGLGYSAMDQMAASTGGKAFYSENNLTKAMTGAVDLGGDSYALTYRPEPYSPDGKWHKVELKVEGPYRLSYRRGYFADAAPGTPGKKLAGGDELQRKALAAVQTEVENPPITFQAKLDATQADGPKGTTGFTVHYGITSRDIEFTGGADGKQEADFKVAAIAFDRDGHIVDSALQEERAHFGPAQMEAVGRIGIPVDQKIAVGKNASYLLLAVVDAKSGRSGTVQLSVDSAKTGE